MKTKILLSCIAIIVAISFCACAHINAGPINDTVDSPVIADQCEVVDVPIDGSEVIADGGGINITLEEEQVIPQWHIAELEKILAEIVAQGDPFCTWNEGSVLGEIVPLYSPTDVINGYIATVLTKGESIGYLQVTDYVDDGRLDLHSYGYTTGGLPVDNMRSNWRRMVNDSFGKKLYYVADFAVKTDESTYEYLLYGERASQLEMEISYNEYVSDVLARREVIAEILASDDPEELAASVQSRPASSSLVYMSDFSGIYVTRMNGVLELVHSHCAPTAAVNVLNYFLANNECTLSAPYSNVNKFTTFFYAMDTNSISTKTYADPTGTLRCKTGPGYEAASDALGAYGSEAVRTVPASTSSWNNILSAMSVEFNSGKIIILSMDRCPVSSVGHAVTAYSCGASGVVVADGISSGYVTYDSDDSVIAQFVSIGY